MIQINDRADFTDKFTALMAADIALIHAGIDPESPLIPEMIDTFLEQFDKPEPVTYHIRANDVPYAYVIVDKWDGRSLPAFKDSIFATEEAATAFIKQSFDRPDFNEFTILPLYA